MGSKLYVGNLPYAVRDHDLQQAFAQFGTVHTAKVMMERDTGRSKGFGFVEMGSEGEASAAIQGMNGQPLGGRSLVVNEARPMEPRPPRSGFNGGYNHGGGNNNYAGRNEGGFRSPYGTGPRNRNFSNTDGGYEQPNNRQRNNNQY
ncbi:RNA recognition motif domain-containing protein [Comamonas sp.]